MLKLPKSEAELISKLQSWLGEECAVAFLTRLLRVSKVEEGLYSVPSASTDKAYLVNLKQRTCPCESHTFRKRCVHVKLAYVKHLLEQ
jgi:hypothetical protein